MSIIQKYNTWRKNVSWVAWDYCAVQIKILINTACTKGLEMSPELNVNTLLFLRTPFLKTFITLVKRNTIKYTTLHCTQWTWNDSATNIYEWSTHCVNDFDGRLRLQFWQRVEDRLLMRVHDMAFHAWPPD